MTPHELMVHQHMVAFDIASAIGMLLLPASYLALFIAVMRAGRKERETR